MNRVIIILIFLLFQLSCNNHKRYIDFKGNLIERDYGKGEYIKYYTDGTIKMIQLNRNILSDDTLFYFLKLDTIKILKKNFSNKYYRIKYDEKGILWSKGFVDSTFVKVGIWNYYINAKPFTDVEYYNIGGEEFYNRIWDKNNNDLNENRYYYIKTDKDTINVGERIRLKIFQIYPYYYESDLYVLIPQKKYFDILKDNFYNANEIEYDTFANVAEILKKQNIKTNKYHHLQVPVDIVFSKPGMKRIKGIVLERFETKDTIFIREMLFTKEIFVKNR